MSEWTLNIHQLGNDLGIPLPLLMEYSDNYEPKVSEGLVELLSHPNVLSLLSEVRREKPGLYKDFVEALLEEHYAFLKQPHLSRITEPKQARGQFMSMIRPEDERTPHSDIIRARAMQVIDGYQDELTRLEMGVADYGSTYYGDATPDSDIDLIFYTSNLTPETVELAQRIREGIKEAGIGCDRCGPFDLHDILERSESMINGQLNRIGDYNFERHKPCPDIFSQRVHQLSVAGSGLYNPNPELEGMLSVAQQRIFQAADSDPFFGGCYSVAIAKSMTAIAEKREKR